MIKIETKYAISSDYQLIVSEEVKNHMSIVEYGEACSGILKHWGSKEKLIGEMKHLITLLEKFKPQ
jgi:hypothetical protein